MKENKLVDESIDFAVKVLKIREANYAHGKSDFVAKLQIALKECYETEYWLELFQKAEILDADTAKNPAKLSAVYIS